jgi:enoyl-CoA hydratase/carnithine racemase
MQQYETILIDRDADTEWLTLNRPEALNALNPQMVAELTHYFQGLASRSDIRIVVLKAAGRAFCAGLDMRPDEKSGDKTLPRNVIDGLALQRAIAAIYVAMRKCPQPIIALIDGAACGGGFSLAMASDIRIASKTAKMNCAYIRVGYGGCDMGSSYFLPRLVGASLASELILTGKFIHADRALAAGLVSRVVATDEELDEAALEDIGYMRSATPFALRLTKDVLNANLDANGLEAAMALEDRNQILAAQTNDAQEAMAAFLEKRPPQFTGS